MAIPRFWLIPAVCLLFPFVIQFPLLKYNCSSGFKSIAVA
jgi:hypothetical protein